jgi:glycosyltransferase involved in cell wall biosynthesis
VIPSKNRPERMAALIETLRRQDYPADKFDIVVIDDGSTPPYHFMDDKIKVIRHDTSRGAQKSRNEGLQIAGGELALVLDDDIELLNDDFISRSVQVLIERPEVVAVFGRKNDVLHSSNETAFPRTREFSVSRLRFYSGDLVRLDPPASGPILWSHSVFLARRQAVLDAGGYDGIYGLNGGHSFREESDLQARLRKQGCLMWFLPDIAFNHHIVPGGGHGPSVRNRLYWIAHNHMVFLHRHIRFWPFRAIGFLLDIARYSWAQSRFRHTFGMLHGYVAGWRNALRDQGPGQNPWFEKS